jgi:excisionase family DNA binding protein
LLSVLLAAKRLSIARGTCYRLIKAGTIPSVRVGGSVRVDPVELDRWLAAQRTDAA